MTNIIKDIIKYDELEGTRNSLPIVEEPTSKVDPDDIVADIEEPLEKDSPIDTINDLKNEIAQLKSLLNDTLKSTNISTEKEGNDNG